jgi:RNA polymerase sigma-70 factor (ECF subfamily)
MSEELAGSRHPSGTLAMQASQITATQQLWTELHERLLQFVQRRVENAADAEDIVQDVFVRIHASADRLDAVDSVSGWVYRIARNVIVDHYRSQGAKRRTSNALGESARVEEQEAPGVTTPEDAEGGPGSELANCMEPLMQQLPDHYRDAIAMTEIGGISQVEAAERTGISVSGMKSRVQRGRSKLKDLLLDCCSVDLDQRRGVIEYEPKPNATADRCGCGSGAATSGSGCSGKSTSS